MHNICTGHPCRHELIDFNVSVHLLEPGFFTTNITQTATNDLDKVWERLDQETKEEYGKQFFDECEAFMN